MFKKFTEKYKGYKSKIQIVNGDDAFLDVTPQEFHSCIELLGGHSYNHGLYQVFAHEDVEKYSKMLGSLFPEYKGEIIVFSCDWLGRYFAVDKKTNYPSILMMETGAGEVMDVPVSVTDFHNIELIAHEEDLLAKSFFEESKSNKVFDDLNLDECIGYKLPLFLGGEDTVGNLELGNRDVYTGICAQLRTQTLQLKDGERIGSIQMGGGLKG